LVMGVFSKQPVSAMTAPASNAALALIFVIRFPGSFRQFTEIAPVTRHHVPSMDGRRRDIDPFAALAPVNRDLQEKWSCLP
jgi:hypothetical protein